MKRYLLIIAGVFFLSGLNAQVSVFDCGLYQEYLSPSQVNSQQTINGTCIVLGTNGAIQVNNSTGKSVFASQSITLKNDVHIGAFDASGGAHLKITGKAGLEVVVMNYTDLYGVLRYKKAEFGIRLPDELLTRINHFLQAEGVHQDELNPFLEWDIDVEATFTHPASGTVRKVDGYYTREYSENPATDDWDDIGTDYPFRIRFAPPLNGGWIAEISIRIDNAQQPAYISDMFSFNVVESGDPGYVKVHENQRNLKQGDKMIVATGMNFVSPDDHSMAWGGGAGYLGQNLFSSSNTEKACNTKEWANFRQKVELFFQEGGKYIKTMQFPWSSLIEFEKKGNYYKRLHYVWEQDKLLDLCEQYDVLMLFDLMYQVTLEKCSGYGMYYWDWDNYLKKDGETDPSHLPDINGPAGWYYNYRPYCYNDDPSWRSGGSVHYGAKKPYEMFTNENDLAYHKQRTRYYVARYGYSTKIFEFELLSEPWSLNNAEWATPYDDPSHEEHVATRNAVKNYHEIMSAYMKDSLKVDQLIGIDIHYWNDKPLDQLEESIELEKIDIVGTNPYYAAPNATFAFSDYVQKIHQKHGSVIPVILAEGGVDEAYTACSEYSQHPVDMMTFPFTGVAGYFTWFGMQEGLEHLWPATIRAQQHMDSEQVIETLSEGNGQWVHGKQEEKLFIITVNKNVSAIETQYYVSNNKEAAVGYVRNRTYNVHTTRLNDACILPFIDEEDQEPIDNLENIKWNDTRIFPLNRRLRVKGLKKNMDYRVDYYSYKTGTYLSTQCDHTSSAEGELVLNYDELIAAPYENKVLNPVTWFVLWENGCSQGMIVKDDEVISQEALTTISEYTHRGFEGIKIYPNPFDSFFTIEFPTEDRIIIQTIEGKVIREDKVEKGIKIIPMTDFPRGTYILKLQNKSVTFKIVKL